VSMPRLDEATREYFHAVLPAEAGVTVRPMFGNLAAFVNGNMFAGVFGTGVFARLSETERDELLALPGAAVFAPMPDRPMREYVMLPDAWRHDADEARAWLSRSLRWAATLPPKEKAPRKAPMRKR
jgi:TfoX/Sxy family transcriptional regulator of competence genes